MTPRVLLASGVAVAAVGFGLLLGLGSGGGSALVGPLRTFAFAAALTVALTHLLPEALGELGAPALLLFAAASVAPAWGELLRGFGPGAREGGGHGTATLGAGYVGLLLHHVGDGLGLGAYSELPGGAVAHADVLAALAVHTVPLVAVVTLAFRVQRGTRTAIERAVGLAGASVVGVLLSGVVPESLTQSLSAWIAAGVAGLLLHVVTHDLGRDLPATAAGRGVDWLAAGLGVATSALGADAALSELRHAIVADFVRGFVEAAPALVLGLALAWGLGRLRIAAVSRWLSPLPGAARALDGAAVGAALAGVRFGILFWLGAALTARISAWRTPPHSHTHDPPHHDAHADEHRAPHADAHADSHAHADSRAHADSHTHAESHAHVEVQAPLALRALIRESAPWIATGLVMHALLVAALRDGALATLGMPSALGGAALCGLALELPAVTAVLIALALWERGLRADAALAFALMATAKSRPSWRPLGVALLVGIGVGSSNALAVLEPLPVPLFVSNACAALVVVGITYAAWTRGIRGFFADIFHSHDSA